MTNNTTAMENYLTETNRFLLNRWPTKKKTNLEILSVENAIILPWKPAKESWGAGGIVDENGRFVEDSKYVNGWSKYGGGYEAESISSESEDAFIWMGIFVKQWGHFLLDCINRLWCVNDGLYKNLKIVYVCEPSTEIDGNYLRFLELLGIKKENLVKISEPTKVRQIYIPQCSFMKFEYYTEQYLNMFDTVCKNSNGVSQWSGKNIYFTREAYSHGLKAKDFGLGIIRKTFSDNGFICLEPQSLSLDEQISIWNSANVVACVNGSIPLNLLLCRNPGVKVIVCNKTSREHENLRIIEAVTNHRVMYIDVFDPRWTNKEFSLGRGPFLCTMTDQFKSYLSDHQMKYTCESLFERVYAIIRFNIVRLYRAIKDR